MNKREDFEIYTITINGRVWYRFKVEYYGVYTASSEKQILKLREKIKQEVKEKLEWIEEENQKYYARMAEQERQRALLFKKTKELEQNKRLYI